MPKHLTCVSRTYSQLQPTNLTYFSLLISRQVVGVFTCPNTSLVSPGPTPNFSLSRYSQCSSPGKLSESSLVQTPHLCLQDLLPTSACRDTPSISKHVVSGNQLTSHISQMTLQPTCHRKWSETKTHHLNSDYSSSSMPLTLHQQGTNIVSTANL